MIRVQIDHEALADLVAAAVRKEVEPLMRLLEDRKLSQEEAMRVLGIKSHYTMRQLVKQGVLKPCQSSGRPKYLFSDIINLKNKHL